MRILIIGKTGQVGFELQRSLSPLGEIIAVDRAGCDLTNKESIFQMMNQVEPNIIVNAAAYTTVDRAETEEEKAFAVNAIAPGLIGEAAARIGALVVHYSTDYVFDGTKELPYTEDDYPNPQSVYGKSKLAGEFALKRSEAEYLIFRTSWVFGIQGHNFIKTILKLAEEREHLEVVADQFGAPTSAALIADVTAQVIQQYQRQGGLTFPFGLYHLTAAGKTSWYEYAKTIVELACKAGKSLRLDSKNIHPTNAAKYSQPAPRPSNSCLNTKKLKDTFKLVLPDWRQSLDEVLWHLLRSNVHA